MNHTLFFFFHKYLHCHVFFSDSWTKTQLFLSCLQFQALSDPPTAHQGPLGDQIAYTVGHGAPGTFELMNYHLLHVKCHCRFMPLEQDEFSFSATTLSLTFSQWHDNVISQPTSNINENERLFLNSKILLARWLQVEWVSFGRQQIYISPVCFPNQIH